MSFPAIIRLNDEDVLKQTEDQRLPLGTQGITRDGRKFRYAQAGGTALVAHTVVQSAARVSTGVAADNYFATAPTTNSTVAKLRFLSTNTLAGSTANFYKDGFVWVRTGTGGGEMVRILSHSAATTTALAGHAFNLAWDSKFAVAPVTTTAVRVGLIQNPYKKVIKASTVAYSAQTAMALGVAPRAVTASYYFWLQTGGLCVAKRDGTINPGWPVRPSSGIAGAHVTRMTAASTAVLTAIGMRQIIGIGHIAGSTVNSQFCVIKLTID